MIAAPILAYAAIATSVAAAGVSAYGAMQQGAAAQKAANYQSAVAQNNATIQKQNADTATQVGDVQAENKLMESGQHAASIRAAAGANGLDANTGTPLNLQSDTAKIGQVDAMTIRNNASRQAYGFQVQGMSDTAQSQLDIAQGQNASAAGTIGAFSSVLSGASSVSDKWAMYESKNGPLTGGA